MSETAARAATSGAVAPAPARDHREHRQRLIALAVLGVALLTLPFGLNNYTQFVVNTMIVYCVVALGFNVIIG